METYSDSTVIVKDTLKDPLRPVGEKLAEFDKHTLRLIDKGLIRKFVLNRN
jgi:hypothetical protein